MKDLIISILVPFVIILGFSFVLIRISMMIRRKGGSLTHIVYGANQEILTKDQDKAIEIVVKKNANKKEEEEESGESK